MLAAVLPDYGPASRLKVQLVDLPRLPLGKLKASEAVVEIHAASVNPTDWKQRKGTLAQLCPLNLPTILGIDFSGPTASVSPTYQIEGHPCHTRIAVSPALTPHSTIE